MERVCLFWDFIQVIREVLASSIDFEFKNLW